MLETALLNEQFIVHRHIIFIYLDFDHNSYKVCCSSLFLWLFISCYLHTRALIQFSFSWNASQIITQKRHMDGPLCVTPCPEMSSFVFICNQISWILNSQPFFFMPLLIRSCHLPGLQMSSSEASLMLLSQQLVSFLWKPMRVFSFNIQFKNSVRTDISFSVSPAQ